MTQSGIPFKQLSSNRFFWPLMMLLLIWAINLVVNPEFFQLEMKDARLYGSLIDVFNRSAPLILLAMGMSLVIATGGIDLSVGAVMAIAGAVSASLIAAGTDNVVVIICAGLGAGLAAGLTNGCLISFLGIQPTVATLVLMVAGRGLAQLISNGQIVTFQNEAFAFIGTGSIAGFPAAVVISLLVFVALHILLRKTVLALLIESCGCNARAAHYAGVSVSTIRLFVYCISGFCAALAGLIVTADIQGADGNNAGLWLELDAILAVVIGGASLTGGRFSLGTAIIGVLVVQSLSTTIIMSGISPRFNLLIKALVILLILLLQSSLFREQLGILLGLRRKTL